MGEIKEVTSHAASDRVQKRLPCASVDRFGQGASLTRQVETQIQVMQVQEDVATDMPDGVLGDAGKYVVPQFVKCTRTRFRHRIWNIETPTV